jgi:hypothetical protein
MSRPTIIPRRPARRHLDAVIFSYIQELAEHPPARPGQPRPNRASDRSAADAQSA